MGSAVGGVAGLLARLTGSLHSIVQKLTNALHEGEGQDQQVHRLSDTHTRSHERGLSIPRPTSYTPQRRRDFFPPFFFARRSPRLPATSPD